MSSELQAAVENAYREFARYRLKGAICVCNCPVCVDAETERKLCTVPLREMPALLLGEYTHSAHGWDDRVADEFRYFLPRYFELIAADDPPTTIGIEVCLDRLHQANYRNNWPTSEADVVDAFFLALFHVRLAEPVDVDPNGLPTRTDDPFENTLCMIAYAGGDVEALLKVWDADSSREATLHIAGMVITSNWQKRGLRNSFWYGMDTRPHGEAVMRRLIAWLLRWETLERLEVAASSRPIPARRPCCLRRKAWWRA